MPQYPFNGRAGSKLTKDFRRLCPICKRKKPAGDCGGLLLVKGLVIWPFRLRFAGEGRGFHLAEDRRFRRPAGGHHDHHGAVAAGREGARPACRPAGAREEDPGVGHLPCRLVAAEAADICRHVAGVRAVRHHLTRYPCCPAAFAEAGRDGPVAGRMRPAAGWQPVRPSRPAALPVTAQGRRRSPRRIFS